MDGDFSGLDSWPLPKNRHVCFHHSQSTPYSSWKSLAVYRGFNCSTKRKGCTEHFMSSLSSLFHTSILLDNSVQSWIWCGEGDATPKVASLFWASVSLSGCQVAVVISSWPIGSTAKNMAEQITLCPLAAASYSWGTEDRHLDSSCHTQQTAGVIHSASNDLRMCLP